MASRVLNNELNTHFESCRFGVFNGQRSTQGLTSYIII